MKRMCREPVMEAWSRRQLAVTALLRHAKVVKDPRKLEYLNAQLAKRKARAARDLRRAQRQPAS